jgi:alpha-beta hydrolase superfamily lysophospholipase
MTQGYKKLFSYSHSTGSSVLLDYINRTHRADSVFAGLVFNSPFLGWGSADGQVEALADHVMAKAIDAGDISAKMAGGSVKTGE